jgi:hypothetical protein
VNERRSRRRKALLFAVSSTALSSVLALAGSAGAVTTERFVLDDEESLSAGELIRSAVHSDGRVTSGAETRRIALPDDVPVVYSAVQVGDAIYLGTGNDGRIYRVRGDRAELFAETRQLLVASLAVGDGGALYAGTLPEGRIYRIAPDGAVTEFARPDQTEHVWALAWDAQRSLLFAGTGPEGRVVAINRQGQATVWWDSPAAHVMSLALAGNVLYAGTSDEAVVARITAADRVEVVHDFPGNEITALAVRGNELAVAANEFPAPPSLSSSSSQDRSPSSGRSPRQGPGKGRIWHVRADGRTERVFERTTAHVTSLAILDDGTFVAGLGGDGHVVRVNPDRTFTTWIDVEERQVLAISMGNQPFFATGDGAAVYRIVDARPRDAIWESKVLDARFRARWGQLDWRAEGNLVLQTRSGNTEEPDTTWSDWSADMNAAGPIRSPEARYLQVRARFERDPAAVLRAVTAYFLPQNQRPVVSNIRVEGPNDAATKRMRSERQSFVPEPSALYKLAWTVDNTDDDRLRYRLRYRREDQNVWRDMLRSDQVITDDEYSWNTASIPDGFYVVRVEASDELDNPEDLTLRHTADSEPIRVDNHAPRVEDLRAQGTRVTGRAIDSLGPIARLERAIDGGEWQTIFPTDDLFDTADERFEIDISSLPPGVHIVAVRATDAGGNVGSAEAQVRR